LPEGLSLLVLLWILTRLLVLHQNSAVRQLVEQRVAGVVLQLAQPLAASFAQEWGQ
jgi:hypothetical protein